MIVTPNGWGSWSTQGFMLPIDPGNSGTIDYYDDLSKVQRAWEDCEGARW
jgi:hypothetical protein